MLLKRIFKREKEQLKPKTLAGTLGIFYLSSTYPYLPRFICSDGFELSIQYDLSAKRDIDSLELGMLSSYEPLLDEYAEDKGECITVFAYVPIPLVRHIVEDIHGGIVGWKGLEAIEQKNKSINKVVPHRNHIFPERF